MYSAYYARNNKMLNCDTLIRNASILDGSGATPELLDVALRGDRICEIGPSLDYSAKAIVDAKGLSLSPGFIDVHTHDDTSVIQTPAMLPKLSQGVTTVIIGNCGISASPVQLRVCRGDP
jgi:N-acyl-D-aspartate/D-glutamate deacylase